MGWGAMLAAMKWFARPFSPLSFALCGALLGLLLAAPARADSLPPSPFVWRFTPLSAPKDLNRYLPADHQCPVPATPLGQQLARDTAPAGGQLGCGNLIGPLIYFPQEDGPFGGVQPASPHGGFDVLAADIRAAKQEVLLANMFWDDGPDYPGRLLLGAVAELRRNVAAHPEQYPRGMVVRLSLGDAIGKGGLNLNPLGSLTELLQSLLAAGLPLPGQPDSVPGFRLEVGNWPYLMPHSHAKLLVIDGETAVVGGYNITAQHLPPAHPSGKSQNEHDLALTLRGPAARQVAAAFDDIWENSRSVTCTLRQLKTGPDFYCPPRGMNHASTHTWLADPMPQADPQPQANPQTAAQEGGGWVFPIYRRSGFYSGDAAITTLLGAADSHLDLMQSQVSGTFACTLTWGAPGGCTFPKDALPMWKAVLDSIVQRHVHVRLLIDQDTGSFVIETYMFIRAMQDYLKAQGLSEYFEVRFFGDGRQHTKVILVDDQMAELGSYNLHYSSQGALGLNEYGVATDDPATLKALRAQFEYEWPKGRPVVLPKKLQ